MDNEKLEDNIYFSHYSPKAYLTRKVEVRIFVLNKQSEREIGYLYVNVYIDDKIDGQLKTPIAGAWD